MYKMNTENVVFNETEAFLNERYTFRMNEVTGRLEWKKLDAEKHRLLTDYNEKSLLREVKARGIKCNPSDLRNILCSDFSETYNPFEDYFDGLEAWDGVTDYISSLAETVNVRNDENWANWLKKWLVGAVACALDSSAANHQVLVLSGAQGTGKTTWLSNLVPTAIMSYLYQGSINPTNKDTLIHLSECFLINLDELENLNSTQIGAFKEIITRTHIRMRRPYGHHSENLVRRATFCGSVNGNQFLHDTTGTRRFLCFEVNSINYNHNIDLDKVYAQALHLYNSGFQYFFTPGETALIELNNEQFVSRSTEEEVLLAHFESCPSGQETDKMTTTEIMRALSRVQGMSVNDSVLQKLGKALSKNGFIRLKHEGVYKYALKRKQEVR